MTRNLKALGLGLLAIFALGAVAASSASAVPLFHSEKDKTVITSESTNETATFGIKSVAGLTVECKDESYRGTISEKTPTSVTVHPTYRECTKTAGLTPTVDTAGCNYVLYAETTKHLKTESGEETDSPVEVECEAGKNIKITTSACTITILSNGVKLHGVVYDNEGVGATRDIKLTITVDKIKYKAPGIGCAIAGLKAEGEDGFLTGDATVKGFEDLCAAGECPLAITPAEEETNKTNPTDGQKDTYKEGAQVGIWWE